MSLRMSALAVGPMFRNFALPIMSSFAPALRGSCGRLSALSLLWKWEAAAGSQMGLLGARFPRLVPGRCHHVVPSTEQQPLKQWTQIVHPFSTLEVQLPCHVTVSSQDPHAYPDADRVFVTLSGVAGPLPHELAHLEVKYDELTKRMTILSTSIDSRSTVEVRTPARLDLDIKTFGTGSVKIQKVECDSCKVETEKGNSVLQSVKSHRIRVRANGGEVVGLGTVHGNLDIHASGKSTVHLEKLQGATVSIATEDGLLKTKYLYAESSFLSSAAGDIALGSAHGDVMLQSQQGNITVDSSDGSLRASTHRGTIDVYVTQLGKVDLKSHEGCITVKVPTSLQASLRLCGAEIHVSPEIHLEGVHNTSKGARATLSAHMNEKSELEQCIHASTETGRVVLQTQNWFQSLKLQTV